MCIRDSSTPGFEDEVLLVAMALLLDAYMRWLHIGSYRLTRRFFSVGWVGCRKIPWEYDSTTTKAISGRRARRWTVLLQRRLPFVGDSFRVASFLSELKLFVALGMGAMLCSHIFKRFSNYDTLVWSDATGLAVPMCHSQKHHSYFLPGCY